MVQGNLPETHLMHVQPWVINTADHRRITAMWCWRKVQGTPWTAKRSDESVRHETGYREALIDVVAKQRPQCFGHIARRDGNDLERVKMFGKMEGERNRGRQTLRRVDGIVSQTNMSVCNGYTLAQNRHEWSYFIRRATNMK